MEDKQHNSGDTSRSATEQASSNANGLSPEALDNIRRYFVRTAGLLHLGSGVAKDILDVVEQMHGTISRRPLPMAKENNTDTRPLTRQVYRAVRLGFDGAHKVLDEVSRRLDPADLHEGSPEWLNVLGAINGVVGDQLAANDSPLAISMDIMGQAGDPDSGKLVLFLHGLCLSEHGWQRDAFPEFETWCHDHLSARTAHLRYNSGLHISENGRQLAEILHYIEQNEGFDELILVGYSMGGLLVRSACHYGRNMNWLDKVSHIATLATPHHGAPLERIGNLANSILKISPYSRPIAYLGDLRSAGIKDLRFADLVDEDWQSRPHDEIARGERTKVPLLRHVNYLFLAATRSELPDEEQPWRNRDDMLVTIPSALGLSRDDDKHLEHPRLRREIVAGANHLEVVGNPVMLDFLRDWLSGSERRWMFK